VLALPISCSERSSNGTRRPPSSCSA
jgi:hypothetical protein